VSQKEKRKETTPHLSIPISNNNPNVKITVQERNNNRIDRKDTEQL